MMEEAPNTPLARPHPEEGARVIRAVRRLVRGAEFDVYAAAAFEQLLRGSELVSAWIAMGAARSRGGRDIVALGWATCCELLHLSKMAHQDPETAAIGNHLLLLATAAIEEIPAPELTRRSVARTVVYYGARVRRGQVSEIDLRSAGRLDWAAWSSAATNKTGALLALPVHGAALLAGEGDQIGAQIAAPFEVLGQLAHVQSVLQALQTPWTDNQRIEHVHALASFHVSIHPKDRDYVRSALHTLHRDPWNAHIAAVQDRLRRGGAREGLLARLEHLEHLLLRTVLPAGLDPVLHELLGRVRGRSALL